MSGINKRLKYILAKLITNILATSYQKQRRPAVYPTQNTSSNFFSSKIEAIINYEIFCLDINRYACQTGMKSLREN